METLWFCLVAAMITLYVVFDGFDLGVGIVHLLVARTEGERRQVLRSIGPVWDGNEVWLIATGGVLYFAFPALYASSFSGFYLPLMVVLWLLVLRGIAIEFRNHISLPVWAPFWDAVFAGASLLLAAFYGIALGNVVRGVPLDDQGRFFMPLWTDFWPGRATGILDAYTALVGLAAVCTLALHGALWITLRSAGSVQDRARLTADIAWWCTSVTTIVITIFTIRLQPQISVSLAARPWGYAFPAVALVGLVLVLWCSTHRKYVQAFLASCAFIAGMLSSAAFGLYPYALPSSTGSGRGLTVQGAAAPAHGLRIGLLWWIPGMVLVAAYFVFTYAWFAREVAPGSDDGGY